MAFDEHLAARIRECLREVPDVREQRMFGGLAFLVGGHMACGIETTTHTLVIHPPRRLPTPRLHPSHRHHARELPHQPHTPHPNNNPRLDTTKRRSAPSK